ncbi:superoxide dismutase family protein [Rhodopirellula sp. MGV]|uniref:superoxide dismutase family protein n=1 Tax=Rhodopirellula sp. MGV TaxID=2023130 RepID=UPI000B96D4B5|nr:superoxide dismutase family protein [Rhodopirellula sp. MGV]OYP32957.1 hypothetical protein CGZ80_18835 [Rhodopirellula sp. MGV]PNY35386.1 superoxide dismutase family protein [Rhodopirellula baltica]
MKMRFVQRSFVALALACCVAVPAFAVQQTTATPRPAAPPTTGAAHSEIDHAHVPQHAVAVVFPTQGNDVRGVVVLQQDGDDITVRGRMINLTPGKHGFHIHQYGDLRSVDGKSAGGHYDPEGHDHGGPDASSHHVGDLGNIEANEEGTAEFKMTIKGHKVHLLVGRAIVVHEGEDDLKSQPSGAAGPRAGVGVVGIANPEDNS